MRSSPDARAEDGEPGNVLTPDSFTDKSVSKRSAKIEKWRSKFNEVLMTMIRHRAQAPPSMNTPSLTQRGEQGERSPSTNVSRVRFPDPASYVD